MPLLSIQNLEVEFNSDTGWNRVIHGISLEIEKGETVGLVGESGSGKSVTSMAIMGLIPKPPGRIARGKILFEGKEIHNLTNKEYSEIRGNKISMIFQEPMTSLNPVFSVGDQVLEAIVLHQKVDKNVAREKVIKLFEEVGIPEPEKRYSYYPHEMSGGQKQRVMIAMAIACEPDLLICDEPTTALDVTIQKQVLELLLDIQQRRGMAMLFITHDLGVIGDIADRVLVMYKGNLVEGGTKKDIFTNPNHPYTKGLLACRPSLESNPSRLLTVNDFLDAEGEPQSKDMSPKSPNKERTEPLLKVTNLKKHFPIKSGLFGRVKNNFKAVDGVSFEIQKGKVFGLVGESGCGKTTLGRSLLRLIEPTEGEVTLEGKSLIDLSPKEMRSFRKKAQIIFQDPYSSLNPRMTIGGILEEPLVIHNEGGGKKERMDKAAYYLEKVGLLGEHLNRYPHEFSGGQRQRVCIARALMLEPQLIICDESVSALDVSVQAQVLNLLLDLKEEFDLSYLFISHDLSVVKFISDEVAVMREGKIVEQNFSDEIYNSPQNDYTIQLLEAIPKGMPKVF